MGAVDEALVYLFLNTLRQMKHLPNDEVKSKNPPVGLPFSSPGGSGDMANCCDAASNPYTALLLYWVGPT